MNQLKTATRENRRLIQLKSDSEIHLQNLAQRLSNDSLSEVAHMQSELKFKRNKIEKHKAENENVKNRNTQLKNGR
jgi:hypothetical protein